jgi:broad specificity phosphatase PhoE
LPPPQVAPELRERFFGAALELASHENYCPAWEGDAADPSTRPCGDGESADDVAARALGLLRVRFRAQRGAGSRGGVRRRGRPPRHWPAHRPRTHPVLEVLQQPLLQHSPHPPNAPGPAHQELEARHAGKAVLLVSHGDTLSITLTAAAGGDLRRHRVNGLGTAELRRLAGAGGGGGGGGGGAVAAACEPAAAGAAAAAREPVAAAR